MRFLRARVDGFGAFNDLEIGEFGPGLNLVAGANEAGKSTVLNFFRAVLYGFPSRRDLAERYEPAAGGVHGGLLEVLDDDGKLSRIMRTEGRTLAGRLTIESDSREFAETDAEGELKKLLAGTEWELYRNVFAFSLHELSRFDSLSDPEVADHIYAAAAGTGEVSLPRLLEEVFGRQGELYKAQGRKPEINRLLHELVGLLSELNEAKKIPGEYATLRAELEGLKKNAAEQEAVLGKLRREEKHLELIIRLRAKAVRLDDLDKELERRERPAEPPEGSLERLEEIERELKSAIEISERTSLRLENKKSELEELDLDEALVEHGPEIETLRDKGQVILERLHQLPDLESGIEAMEARAADLTGELGEAWSRERVIGFDTGLEVRETVRRIWGEREAREKVLESTRSELKSKKEEVGQTEKEIDELRSRRRTQTGAVAPVPLPFLIGVPAALILGGVAALILLDTLTVPIILFALGLLSLQWGLIRRIRPGEAGWLDSRLGELKRNFERESSLLESLAGDLENSEEVFRRSDKSWADWLAARELPESWDRDAVFSLVDRLQRIQAELKSLEEKNTTSAGYRDRIDRFMTELNNLLEQLGRERVGEEDCGVVLSRLWKDLKKNREQETERAKITELVKELEGELNESRAVQERQKALLEELLTTAGVGDESELRAASAQWSDYKILSDEKESLERELAEGAGGAERGLELREAVRAREPGAAEAEVLGLKEEIARLGGEQRDNHERIGSLNGEIEGLEKSDLIADLRLREETMRAGLNGLSREWACLALLYRLLQGVQEKYERERQGTVLSRAAHYFERMTLGRYVRVKKPLGERVIRVETARGKTVPTDQLSRGTAEQLYLSLRFALMEEYSRTAGALPILMDDILVNFDPDRLKAAAEGIVELAGNFQVVLFTCHPHVVEIFRAADPGANVINL